MQNDSTAAPLERLLQQFIAAAGDLIGRLDDESSALLGNDLARLEHVTAEKQRCIAVLERLEVERVSLLSAAGGGQPRDDFRGWLRDQDADGRLDELWVRLTAQLEECREHNVRNGRLVAMRRANVVRSLSVLRGADGSVTYDPAGHAESRAPGRDLARV